MVQKSYDWLNGEILDEHSRRKHKIIREYFADYLRVRCQFPARKFRMAIVDGFAGGGRYRCGAPGSPIIFVEELMKAEATLSATRAAQGMPPVELECLLVLNDASPDAVRLLRTHIASLEAKVKDTSPRLHLRVEFTNAPFEAAYPSVRQLLHRERYSSVLFNLDQAGYSKVDSSTLADIMQSHAAPEIFYTFMIDALVAFLQKSDPEMLKARLSRFGLSGDDLRTLEAPLLGKQAWLGAAERVVFDVFRTYAPYVSPFSINNPDGWRYWLIHFAKSRRARQVYNNVLHANSTLQAHFGRSGLNMLAYDPVHDRGDLFLFDDAGRRRSRAELLEDIPRLISERGDAIGVEDFYAIAYNITPAHSDDVDAAIFESPDTEVITPAGRERRRAGTISVGDTIRLKRQLTFFPTIPLATRDKDREET
jgi:three-Cys-motif partner protein